MFLCTLFFKEQIRIFKTQENRGKDMVGYVWPNFLDAFKDTVNSSGVKLKRDGGEKGKGKERRHCGGAGSAFETGDTYVTRQRTGTGLTKAVTGLTKARVWAQAVWVWSGPARASVSTASGAGPGAASAQLLSFAIDPSVGLD
jgi:hypothetical protein